MQRILIWLAGADSEILDKCKKNNKSQRIKFAGFGTLVIIPAIVGLCSMTYAISTVTENRWFFITGGIIWSFIVIAIDRFIIATFYKSKVESNASSQIISIILRYVFAILIGIAVSHPVTLLWFNESISNKIDDQRRNAVTARRNQAIAETNQIPKGSLSEQVKAKTDRRDCLVNLLTLEQSGIQQVTQCGASSGIKECGGRCENIKKEVAQLNKELQTLNTQAAGEIQQELDARNNIQTLTNNDVADIEKTFPKDYLARVDALAEIEKGKPHVTYVKWFLLLFFVFVDILPVSMKLITPMGEYELIRDTLIYDIRRTQEAEREAINAHAETILPTTLEAKRSYDSKEDELTHLTDTTRQFLTEQENIRVRFDDEFSIIANRIKNIKDNQLKTYYADYLNKARQTFNIAWTKAYDKFHEFISNL